MNNEDQKNFIADMLKSEGWKIFSRENKKAVENYRVMATQAPGAISEELRTWYSAIAAGREEAENFITNFNNELE